MREGRIKAVSDQLSALEDREGRQRQRRETETEKGRGGVSISV
jgi:hypothetical protein